MMRLILITTLASTMMWGILGCADEDGQLPMEGLEGGSSTGGEMLGGQQAGMMAAGSLAGTQMAGAQMAGTQTAGEMGGGMLPGGTQTAGTESGGDMNGGTMAAGVMAGESAGSPAGDDMPGGAQMVGDPCETTQPDPSLPCEVTIYEVRNPDRVSLNRMVTVEGVVTSLRSGDEGISHLVLQVSPQSPQYQGPAWSAIWVYLNDAEIPLPGLSIGMNISLTGVLSDFFGQRQLKALINLTDLGGAPLFIEPFGVDAADVATDGSLSESYEGLLVSIAPVEVIEVNPPAGPGDREPTREFVISGGLRVNDFITSLAPLPEVGDAWGQIIGVLRLGNGDYKLEPRNASDIGRPIPQGDPMQLLINEVDYSQSGADNDEFVEIINGGVMPAPLFGVRLDFINGSNNAAYSSYELVNAAEILAPGEMIVVGSESVLTLVPGDVGSLPLRDAIQNGPDGVRLTHQEFGIIDELGYQGLDLSEGSASVEDTDEEGVSNSIGRCTGDSDNNASDFYVMSATPGRANTCQ